MFAAILRTNNLCNYKDNVNIVYDNQVFEWQRYGGISRYFCEIAKRVAKTPGFSASVAAPLYVNAYLNESIVKVRGFSAPRVWSWRKDQIIQKVNQFVTPVVIAYLRPDIVHETYYAFHSSAPKGCPTVVTVYDMIHEKFSEMFPDSNIVSSAKRAAVARASHVICISDNTRKDLMELFNVNQNKISVIHLGHALAADHIPILTTKNIRPFLLYVGDRKGYKNFDRLMFAYATSNTLRQEFALVAFGGGAFSSEELDAQRKLGVNENLVWHVSGGDDVLSSLYQQAIALVYPSLYEGFGIPPLEAMTYGCPVLCSNTSSLPEVVGGAALMFDPCDVDAIRSAIEMLVISKKARDDLVEKGKSRVCGFSWEKCASETMQVYSALTS